MEILGVLLLGVIGGFLMGIAYHIYHIEKEHDCMPHHPDTCDWRNDRI